VHAELLTSRSAFFAKALRKYSKTDQSNEDTDTQSIGDQSIQWREGEEGVVILPADEPDVFANYVRILYTRVLPIDDDPKKPETDPNTVTEDEIKKIKTDLDDLVDGVVAEIYTALGKLYVFCEKIRDVTAKRDLLSSFVKECSTTRLNETIRYPDAYVIRDVYSGTLPSDPLRAFLTDCHVYEGHSEWVGESYKDFPHEFLYDLMVGMYKAQEEPANLSRVKDTKYYLDKLTGLEEGKAEEEMWEEEMEVEKEVE
jgi:hypothetical protein